MRSVRIGRIFGIDVELHASWLVIFGLVFVTLSLGEFPRFRGATGPGVVDLVGGLVTTILFFGSVVAHELSHSLVGRAFGIEVKRITLFIFGGLAQMSEEAPDPKAELFMAAAGPAASVVLAMLFGGLYVPLRIFGAPVALTVPAFYLAYVNLALALFNLVPGFPLDGGRLLRASLWFLTGDMTRATRIATRSGQAFAGLLIALGALQVLAGPPEGRFSGFWLALIGLFLWNAAAGSYQQLAVGRALAGVSVAQIMTPDLVTAPADIPVSELVDRFFLRLRHGRFPLVRDGVLVGTVTLQDVRALSPELWPVTPASHVSHALEADDYISPDAQALSALTRMAAADRGQLLVRDGGRVVGIVTKSDVVRAMRVRDYLGPAGEGPGSGA